MDQRYLGDTGDHGQAGRKAIEEHNLIASPAAVLELEFLHEIGRLRTTACKLVSVLGQEAGLRVCDLPFRIVVEYASKENWARDPFDRLIVANAKANDAALVISGTGYEIPKLISGFRSLFLK